MNGMRQMSEEEMHMVKGGKCNSNYGYYFCCPANSAQMVNAIKKYQDAGQTDKAAKYVQFCYEDCGYRG